MKMIIGGKFVDRPEKLKVHYPYTGEVVDEVPVATAEDVEMAVQSALEGFKTMKKLPAWKRAEILEETAKLILREKKRLTETLVSEVGKTVREAEVEVLRTADIFKLAAEEAKRIHGETLPFDSVKGSEFKRGYFLREPAGIVLAIVPFNVPLALCAHKVAPAIAAGNSIIIKPASQTPLNALILGEILLKAGLPPQAVSVITGPGSTVGMQLVKDPRIRIVSFTGSVEVGQRICKEAGFKKLSLELGSNSPVIVTDTANIERAIAAVVSGGYSIAGQVCISVQRVFVHKKVYKNFVDGLIEKVRNIRFGDPRLPETDMGPVIDEANAIRIISWFEEAKQKGATIAVGGKRNFTLVEPTVLLNVPEDTHIMKEELFGPAVAVNEYEDLDEAIRMANSTRYGLQAGIFTSKISEMMKAIEELQFGGVIINDSSRYRADFMPYGGYKDSGLGREGVRFAIEEMTEIKTIVIDTRE
ncbi:aldehyde dehydrogenase family protein [Pseudothermotoga thermarum]|uniref:Aldehyde Dehydrogenase n=1 Tax=Pseudothermotoga thermarum DSM 5069 TaxID=688269 RepID=F7YXF2_9THEM|nr:aldehyde dehydrogenase family protein [Pseudothermotoga thermarum]AEH51806.1 Aldehyde Dehydrogenase [Pseudothermotoga thermarum DSM 5069]